jgi:hypothetical protein
MPWNKPGASKRFDHALVIREDSREALPLFMGSSGNVALARHLSRLEVFFPPFQINFDRPLGRFIPEEVLSRALYATQFTRQIDKHGYIRFKHWKLYSEYGLAGSEVPVWEYEGTLKVEHQATTLSLYSVRLSSDQKQISEVKNARRLETHFRSPQLDLSEVTR